MPLLHLTLSSKYKHVIEIEVEENLLFVFATLTGPGSQGSEHCFLDINAHTNHLSSG